MATPGTGLGYSPDTPVTVGGGRIFAGFNERLYLGRLRAPGGEPLDFDRLGSTSGPRILDIYGVRSAGLPEPARLFLDPYAAGPNGIPDGFLLDRPAEPWRLAVSIVPVDPSAPAPAPAGPRKWDIVGAEGEVFGYVETDDAGAISINMPAHTGKLVRERVDTFMEITPPEYRVAVLADVLECVLPWESRGIVRGVPSAARAMPSTKPEWSGPVWGADGGKRARRWPFRRT